MHSKMLVVGFLSAASAFTSPAALQRVPAAPARSARTVPTMLDADTLLVALPGMAALGVTLTNSNGAAAPAPAMPAPVASAEKIDVTLARYN
eukprot:CAMPEP_0198655596 /NCGR_PEP_ID=MMETSP1467-20131203/8462_1 /TAXON_ID=1462469 /ORGANISM="unid. sp., Strain CCMP2135" /LENGTH=91 /DNA_ID=CAMNT_0044391603 /DNA_START=56 /DNA_END=328 /DNA_ORIENTATION=+